jgi:hypothetical protein
MRRAKFVIAEGFVKTLLDAGDKLMQFRFIPALLVFLGSYFPLALILALQDISESTWSAGICTNWKSCQLPSFNNPWLTFSILVITAVCLALTLVIIAKVRYKYSVTIIETKPIPNEIISYSFPYIVSFMGFDYGSLGKVAGFAVFFAWLFIITFKAGQVILNPILLIFGWNLYEAKLLINGEPRIARVLSKSNLIPGDYRCEVIQGIYITEETV